MSEFDIEYSNVYSVRSSFKKSSLTYRETFLIKIVKYTGEYYMTSNSSMDTLSDLYEKIKKINTMGFSYEIDTISYKKEIKIQDLFVRCEKTFSIKSIPNEKDILLTDFIKQHPRYFVPDTAPHIFKIYYIYLVDEEAINYINSITIQRTMWEELIDAVNRHVSCFKPINQLKNKSP